MARIAESIIGHQSEIVKLIQLKELGRWPHTMMFVGPSGIGKKKIALAFAQTLVCEKANNACGKCGSCLRIEKMQSESLTLIEPDTELAKPVIKVEKIRNLLSALSLSSDGPARVVIIDQANTLNTQASNALLKTLEEPSQNIFFILIATDVHQVLATVRSRAQIFRFSALNYEQIKQVKPGLADWVYRSSRGQMDRLELLSSLEGAAKREDALSFFEKFCYDENFLMDRIWKDLVKDRAWALFSINCWLQMARDAVILKTQAKKFVLNTDQADRLKQLYSMSITKLLWLCNQLILAEKDINSNADASLVFEDLWIKYVRMD